jgi:hypothetical protein
MEATLCGERNRWSDAGAASWSETEERFSANESSLKLARNDPGRRVWCPVWPAGASLERHAARVDLHKRDLTRLLPLWQGTAKKMFEGLHLRLELIAQARLYAGV